MLKTFWKNHDTTACNKNQYMSAIFYADEEQRQLAEETKAKQQATKKKPISTKILPLETFYEAEDYHQKYLLQRNGTALTWLGVDPDDLVTSHVCCRINGYVGGYGSTEAFDKEWRDLEINERAAAYIRKLVETTPPQVEC